MGFSGLVDVQIVKRAVRSGKIDKFENAKGTPGVFLRFDAFDTIFIYNNNFTGVEFPDKLGLYKVKGTGLRCEYIVPVKFSKTKRAESVGVFNSDQFPPGL